MNGFGLGRTSSSRTIYSAFTMDRRDFVKLTGAAALAGLVPYSFGADNSLSSTAVSVDSLCYDFELKPEALTDAQRAGLTVAVFDLGIYPRNPSNAMQELGEWQNRFRKYHDTVRRVLMADDFAAAKRERKLGIVLACQDASILGIATDEWESKLDAYYGLGLRMLQVTHNERTAWGDSFMEKHDGGLSRGGEALVQAMNERGMIVDLSHCSRQTLLDAVQVSKKPCVVSHAGCRALANTARNKSDEEIKALGARSGYFGVFNMGCWLTDKPAVTMNTVGEHIDHAVQLIGADHVGIGTDGALSRIDAEAEVKRMQQVQKNNAGGPSFEWPVSQVRVPELNAPNRMNAVAEFLLKRGYKDADVRGIIGGNFVNVFRQVCG